MARSAIILCLALFCAVAFAGRYDDKCSYTYNAVARTGAGGSWTACTGPESNRNCAFYQIYDVVIRAGARSDPVTGCEFAFRPTNGKITDSWGYEYGDITFYNPLAPGTHSLAGFIVRADKINVPINLAQVDRTPCNCGRS